MSKTLIIAEKPSVAKEIAHVVGSHKRISNNKDARFGYFEGNKYIVSWCFGHLVQPCYPADYNDEYKKWDISHLPIIPSVWKYTTEGSGLNQYEVLKKLLNSSEVDSVICATDADREGELIFRLVYNESKSRKPVKRLWISSMEEDAIKDGMRKLRPSSEFDTLYYAADARQKADWIVGLNATRYYTVRFGSSGNILTIGRVQTPTVNLIVQRQLEIDNFKPEPYYVLTADTGSFKATKKEADLATANEKAKRLNGREGIVTSVVHEEKKSSPPELYDLTHLQQDADKLFSYSASKTLKLVQSLYEKKLLTYPRTDSQYLSSDMEDTAETVVRGLLDNKFGGKAVIEAFACRPPYIKRVINNKKVSGHHAIIPTVFSLRTDLSQLSSQEHNIYSMVALRFLAAVSVPHEYVSTKVVLTIDSEEFKASGKRVLKGGWKDIIACLKPTNTSHSDDKADDDENASQPLPPLKIGDKFSPVSVSVAEKFTKPPSVYTEAALLKDMQNIGKRIEDAELKNIMTNVDDNGNKKMLGTAATQGAIIDKIIETGYVSKNGRKLYPTEKAFALMKVLPEEIKSPEMTAEWEKKLEEIKDGVCLPGIFMKEIDEFIHSVISAGQRELSKTDMTAEDFKITPVSLGQCPLCGSSVTKNKFGSFSCTGWKSGCKFKLSAIVLGKKLTETQISKLLSKGKSSLIKGFKSKSGKSFDAYLVLKSDGELKFEFKE